jgi:hypothetical protein
LIDDCDRSHNIIPRCMSPQERLVATQEKIQRSRTCYGIFLAGGGLTAKVAVEHLMASKESTNVRLPSPNEWGSGVWITKSVELDRREKNRRHQSAKRRLAKAITTRAVWAHDVSRQQDVDPNPS